MIDWVNAMVAGVVLYLPERAAARLRSERGQAFVEYALVLTLVAVAVVLILQWGAFTGALKNSLQKVIDALNGAGGGTATTTTTP